MIKSIHFHPNGKYAAKFVEPLIEAEKSYGFKTLMVNSSSTTVKSNHCIPYDLNIKNFFRLPQSLFKITRLLWKEKPCYIISHNARSSLLPLLAARLAKISNIIYFNHGIPHLGHGGLTGKLLKLIEYLNCLLSTKIITVSIDMVNELKRITDKEVKLIGNGSACGIDLDTFSKKKYINKSFRDELKIDSKDIVFVYIGRPKKRKGYNFLINLWTKNFACKMDCKLILCGINLEDLGKNLNEIPKNIIPLGFVENIPEILSNSNYLLLPSLHEGLSYACLEAMACECVIIANDVPGIRSLIKNRFNGYLLNINNETEYVNTIKEIKSYKVKQSLIKAALETVKTYDRKKHLKSYMDLIQDLN